MISSPSDLRARLEAAVAVDAPEKPALMTVRTLHELYRAHALKAYNGRHGRKALLTIDLAFAPMLTMYGEQHPDAIRSLQLRAVRQFWIEQGNARPTIGTRMQYLRRAWCWATEVELLDRPLPEIGPLRFGQAPSPARIGPVEITLVEATLPHLSPIIRILLKSILLAGMRPGEGCDCRGCDIDRARPDGLWVYRPPLHKNAWKGLEREIFMGPKVQLLLTPLLRPGRLFFTRWGNPFTAGLLYNAVRHACTRHRLPHWHPNQLRHTAATMLRREAGLDAAQAVLGHAKIETTQVYAERAMQLASAAAIRFG